MTIEHPNQMNPLYYNGYKHAIKDIENLIEKKEKEWKEESDKLLSKGLEPLAFNFYSKSIACKHIIEDFKDLTIIINKIYD